MAVACFTKQFLRCAVFKPTGKAFRTSSNHELRDLTYSRAPEALIYRLSRCHRHFHTTQSATVAKIMTADEMFSRKSLQDYLRTVDTEYSECLRAVNNADLQTDDEEVRAKRMRMTSLAPLVQTIREMKSKQKDFQETESLLKGNRNKLGILSVKCQLK